MHCCSASAHKHNTVPPNLQHQTTERRRFEIDHQQGRQIVQAAKIVKAIVLKGFRLLRCGRSQAARDGVGDNLLFELAGLVVSAAPTATAAGQTAAAAAPERLALVDADTVSAWWNLVLVVRHCPFHVWLIVRGQN